MPSIKLYIACMVAATLCDSNSCQKAVLEAIQKYNEYGHHGSLGMQKPSQVHHGKQLISQAKSGQLPQLSTRIRSAKTYVNQ